MEPSRTLLVSSLFVLIAAAVALWAYPHLSELMPARWDIHE
jgi:uncharacterized membrane protein